MNKKCQHKKIKILSPHTRKKVLGMLGEKQSPQIFKRLSILKLIDEGSKMKHISNAISLCQKTVNNIKSRFLAGGLHGALYDKPRVGRPPVIKKKQIQKITAIACSDPPDG